MADPLVLLFAVVGVIIFLGFIGDIVFKRTNIPDIIWLIVFGVVIGFFFDIRSISYSHEIASVFTTFALIFILFEGSLNIQLRDLFKSMSKTTVITLMSFAISIIATVLIGSFLGISTLKLVLLGAIIGGTSSAVVIPISEKTKVKPETTAVLKLESSFSDVLCILVGLTIMGILAGSAFDLSITLNSLLGSFAIAIFVGVVAGIFWIPVLKFSHKHAKSYLITIAFMLLLYSFVEYISANGAIACLAFGIVLGNSQKISELMKKDDTSAALSSNEKFFYSQIGFFIKAFFFVYLGMLIDFSSPTPFILAGVITLALFLFRPIAVSPVAKKFEPKDRAVVETLIPKGLAAAVLIQIAEQPPYNITIFPGQSSMVMAIVLYTILISSILVFLIEKGWFNGFPAMARKIFRIPEPDMVAGETKVEMVQQVKTEPDKAKLKAQSAIIQKEKKATLKYQSKSEKK